MEELTWKCTEISPGEATSDSGVIIFNLETNATMKGDGYWNTIIFIAFWSSAKCFLDYILNPGFLGVPCLPYTQFSLPWWCHLIWKYTICTLLLSHNTFHGTAIGGTVRNAGQCWPGSQPANDPYVMSVTCVLNMLAWGSHQVPLMFNRVKWCWKWKEFRR